MTEEDNKDKEEDNEGKGGMREQPWAAALINRLSGDDAPLSPYIFLLPTLTTQFLRFTDIKTVVTFM